MKAHLPIAAAGLLCALCASFHVEQSLVFSGGAQVPGDLGDGRFNNCVLEHFYQALCGYYPLLSPGQFFPVRDTLLYSDNHFGTGLPYAACRWAGLSMEGAFQAWLLILAAANAGCLFLLLRSLGVPLAIGCPLAFFGTSTCALAAMTDQPQCLAFFPFVLALLALLRFLRTGAPLALGGVALAMAWQVWCYLYYGYLGTLVLLIVGLVLVLTRATALNWAQTWQAMRARWGTLALMLGVAGVGVGLVAWPYVRFAGENGARPMDELLVLAPTPAAWFTAPATSLVYPAFTLARSRLAAPTGMLFSGWLVWGVTAVALGLFVRRRQDRTLRLAGGLCLSWLAVLACVTTWSGDRGSVYLWLAGHSAALRGFRAFWRVAYLLFVVQAVAAALVLGRLRSGTRSRLLAGLCVVVAWAMAAEVLGHGQPCYSKRGAQTRGEALARAWAAAGDRPVLAYVPAGVPHDFTTLPILHVDAWKAALLRHGTTLNGYSGNRPATHAAFQLDPTVSQAQELARAVGVDWADVTCVTNGVTF